jgi:phage baseplate assembly protein W|tara:strand:+ start:1152 stop:1526 length:375 start_codon:yes stop_codon:yes gene_type:complete
MLTDASFIGFSTVGRIKPPYTLIDFDLVKVDLLNHFNTRKGERVMLPEFGTIIYDLLMDPLDDMTKDLIREDVIRIIKSDPRVEMVDLIMTELDRVILLEVELLYLPNGVTETIAIQFNIELQE